MADPITIPTWALVAGSAAALAPTVLGAMSKPPGSGASVAPPAPVAPAVMPIQDDQAALDARRRKLVAASNRSGRVSTVLSDGEGQIDTLG